MDKKTTQNQAKTDTDKASFTASQTRNYDLLMDQYARLETLKKAADARCKSFEKQLESYRIREMKMRDFALEVIESLPGKLFFGKQVRKLLDGL